MRRMGMLYPMIGAALVASLSTSHRARAQSMGQGADIDLQAFRPAIDSRGFITVNSPRTLGHLEPSFGLVTSWGKSVLRFEDGERRYEVEHLLSPTLIGAVGLRLGGLPLELAAAMPWSVMVGDRGPDSNGGTPADPNDDEAFGFSGQGLGDISLHLKARILAEPRSGIGAALIASVTLPTATDERAWLGDDSASTQLLVAVERRVGPLRLAVNGGFRYRTAGEDEFRDQPPSPGSGAGLPLTGGTIAVGSTIPFGAAAAWRIAGGDVELLAELFGAVPLTGDNYQPLEAIGGLRVYLAESSYLTLGGGAGLMPDQGANPDLRAFLGIVFEPRSRDRDGDGIPDPDDACPLRPEDFDHFEDLDGCPDDDNDVDGILDRDDQCPLIPEDRDGIEDGDGCPEDGADDRDGDDILDPDDACPDQPEDVDGFEDADGCPDPDNDEDRILDVDDLCPDEPEDVDRFEDGDGCPEADNDTDAILDVDDDCPRVDGETRAETAEVKNGVRDDDGCPDGRIRIGTTMEILEKIHFAYDSARILPRSFSILEEIARTLEMNPQLRLIEVQGHTDERGSEAYNLDLSQRRVDSVIRHLTGKGVERSRLEGRGMGESTPKNPAHTEAAWAENRRVEFHIIKRAD